MLIFFFCQKGAAAVAEGSEEDEEEDIDFDDDDFEGDALKLYYYIIYSWVMKQNTLLGNSDVCK